MHDQRFRLAYAISWAVVFFLIGYPLLWLGARALSGPQWQWTLENFRAALSTPKLREALWNTVTVSGLSAMLSVLAGGVLAWLSARSRIRGKPLWELLALSPFLTPPIVASIAWIMLADDRAGLLNVLFESLGVPIRLNIYSLAGMIFVTSLVTVPVAYLLLKSSLYHIDADIEEQALLCGASRKETFRRITLPLWVPALASAALLCFLQSNIHFGIHAPLGMPANLWMLTTLIYTSTMVAPVDLGAAAAMSSILSIVGISLLAVQWLWLREEEYASPSSRLRTLEPAPLRGWKYPGYAFVWIYLSCAVLLPYGALFLRSMKLFQVQAGLGASELFTGWSYSAYAALWTTPASSRAVLNSFFLGLAAAASCALLAPLCAYLIFRTRAASRHALQFMIVLAPAVSGVVVGVAFLFAFGGRPFALYGTFWILLLAYVFRELATVVKSLEGPCRSVHSELEDAAAICGASWPTIARKVLIPLWRPALAAGAILVFAASFRELGASSILYSYGHETLGSLMTSLWQDGQYQGLCALAVASSALCLGAAGVIHGLWGGNHASDPR